MMIGRTTVPWRHAATAYLRRGACARIHSSVYSHGRRVRLHTPEPFRRASAVTSCPIYPCPRTSASPCVHCALRSPWPILCLLLGNGWIHTLILGLHSWFTGGLFYIKSLAQGESHLNSPKQPAEDCYSFCSCSARCHLCW